MTKTEAYVFLGQVRGCDNKIRRLERTIESLRSTLLPGAIRYDKDRVDTSPQDNMTEIYAKIDEYERQLAEEVQKRTNAILKVDDAPKSNPIFSASRRAQPSTRTSMQMSVMPWLMLISSSTVMCLSPFFYSFLTSDFCVTTSDFRMIWSAVATHHFFYLVLAPSFVDILECHDGVFAAQTFVGNFHAFTSFLYHLQGFPSESCQNVLLPVTRK